MPKLSIIIPVYNKVLYLDALLAQIREQSFQDFECLLIDDGSSDGSAELCDCAVHSDPRFIVQHIPNGGVSHARNLGLSRAQGEYLTFIDSDDEIHPEYLQNLYSCIVRSGADFAISGYQKFWADDRPRVDFHLPYAEGLHAMDELLPDFCRVQKETGVYGCCTAKIFSRDLAEEIRFDESLKLAEDFDFYLKLYAKIKTIYVDFAPYYFYRQAAENSSALRSDYDYDYLSQLSIYLHCRKFLQTASFYSGENKSILDALLQDYTYFTAFYCEEGKMKSVFSQLANLMHSEKIDFHNTNRRKAFVLSMLYKKHYAVLRSFLMIYRSFRKLMKRSL